MPTPNPVAAADPGDPAALVRVRLPRRVLDDFDKIRDAIRDAERDNDLRTVTRLYAALHGYAVIFDLRDDLAHHDTLVLNAIRHGLACSDSTILSLLRDVLAAAVADGVEVWDSLAKPTVSASTTKEK